MSLRYCLAMVLLVSMTGCSVDSVQQLAYFVAQNYGQLQCQKRMTDDCKSQSFDAYQRERQEVREEE